MQQHAAEIIMSLISLILGFIAGAGFYAKITTRIINSLEEEIEYEITSVPNPAPGKNGSCAGTDSEQSGPRDAG